MKKRFWVGCFSAFGVAVLILDAQTALNASREAIQLCIRVIIPSLFPFFVLINLLSNSMLGCRFPFLTLFERWLHLPTGSGSLFLSGLLGGYPTGAQQVHNAWRSGSLDRENAQRMLAFCSNAGPAFIFGIVGPMFTDHKIVWVIWMIHILSSVLVGCIFPKEKPAAVKLHTSTASVSASLKRSVSVIGYVCGWVVLFRVIASFCSLWFLWYFPQEVRVLFTSLLELANGCTSLDLIKNEGLRMVAASAAVNFGGLCVLMQTASVTEGLKIDSYLKGKLLQTAYSIMFSLFAQYFLFPANERIDISSINIAAGIGVLLVILFFLRKNRVAFRGKIVYNGIINK